MRQRTRILAYDASYKSKFRGVEATWFWGALLFRRGFDLVVAADNWDDVLDECVQAAVAGPVELHFWGHGRAGQPLCGDPHARSSRADPADERWASVHTVWFRCCDVFRGEVGYRFAERLVENGCRAIAHTVIVGWKHGAQSHLYGLVARGRPWWPQEPKDGATLSSLFAPRTVMFWNMRIPDWAFGPHPKELKA